MVSLNDGRIKHAKLEITRFKLFHNWEYKS